MYRSILVVSLTAFVLSGCVVGQKLEMDYTAEASQVQEKYSVKVSVTDDRPYVVSGDKKPWYIGKYRAGFGIPWDVTTDNDQPLADMVAGDVEQALRAKGFAVAAESPKRVLSVAIKDWNFDGYQDGRFWYELDVAVTDANGTSLASSVVKGDKNIEGTFWEGAKGGFEKQMPGIYDEIMRSIVDNNEEILEALRL
jgi:hypothetical protein